MHLTVFSMFQNDNFNETELVISKTLFTVSIRSSFLSQHLTLLLYAEFNFTREAPNVLEIGEEHGKKENNRKLIRTCYRVSNETAR